MPEMTPPAVPASHVLALPPAFDDDIALGCECADPALQIERWAADSAAGDGGRTEAH